MIRRAVLVFGVVLLGFPGCSKSERAPMAMSPSPSASSTAKPRSMAEPAASGESAAGGGQAHDGRPAPNQVPADARKIIRTAELTIETKATDEANKKIHALATSKGGFVVSSDTSRYRGEDGAEAANMTIVLRVPSQTFEETLEALRGLGTRVSHERVSGQDVTEEYLDVEARLRSQRAVEEQYLLILKQARSINDTLEVQKKLGEVRGEIERAEGRRRYLESQTSLSTITVHLARHIDAVEAEGPGFGRSIKRAARDSIEVGIGIINGIIRLFGVLIPVTILIVLPLWLLVRVIRRRRKP